MEVRLGKTIRHPVMKLLVDFNNIGFDRKNEWIEITDDILDISGSKEKSGRQIGSVTSDIATFVADNTDKKYSNDNQSSLLYGKIKSNLKFRLLTGFEGEDLVPYASGYIEAFTPAWRDSKVQIKTTDYFKLFKEEDVPEESYQDISHDALINILCDHVGLPNFITRHIPKTEFYYNYFKFEEENCFEALKGLMEICAGEAFFEQEQFYVKTKLALDYQLDTTVDHDLTVDDLLDFEENVDSQTIINSLEISSQYKTIAPLEVVFETPENVVKVENEQISYTGGNSIYIDQKNLPMINTEEETITLKNLTQGRTIYINGHNPNTGKIDIHPDSLANLALNDVLAVSYSYQQLALLAGQIRKYTFVLNQEVDSLNALDIAVWDENGIQKMVYSETANAANTVSKQAMTFDIKSNTVTLTLKNNYAAPITISTLQLRGYPIKVISPIEVFIKDLPSIEEFGKKELSVQNNYINNIKLAEKIGQYIVDNNKKNRKRISIDIPAYSEFTLDDVTKVAEERSGTNHKFTIERIDYTFNTDSGWTLKSDLLELDSAPWVYESFKGESWQKTDSGTPDEDFLKDISANVIKNGGAELYTGFSNKDDVGAINQQHIVPDYWNFERVMGNATARIRDGGNLVLHGLHSFEITTSNSGSGFYEQLISGVKSSETYILSFVASLSNCSGRASVLQYADDLLERTDQLDISSDGSYELMIGSLSTTTAIVIQIEKLAGTAGSESLIFDKVKFENAKEKTPYIESEETSAVQIGQRYANSLTVGNQYGIQVVDENGNDKVLIGQYEPHKYGLKVFDGAIEIVNGLPKNQINPDAVASWDNAEKNAKDYADTLKTSIDDEMQDIRDSIEGTEGAVTQAYVDGVIDEVEAKVIESHLQQIDTEKADIDSRFASIYNHVNLLGAAKTNLNAAKTAYNTAHANLKTNITNSISDNLITDTEKTDVNTRFVEYRTSLTTLATRFEEAIRSIEQKVVDVKDTSIRQDLRLTAPLPSSIKMDANGFTAYTADPNKYARMDHRGLYIAGGALQIDGGIPDTQITNAGKWNKNGTYIDQNGIYTGTVEASKILVSNGKLTDAQIANADIWHAQGTYIDETGVYTGQITWDQGFGGTLQLGGNGNTNGELTVLDDEGNQKMRLGNDTLGFGEIDVDYIRNARNVLTKNDEGDLLFDQDQKKYIVYVDGLLGNDEIGNGLRTNPFSTITAAIQKLPRFLDYDVDILVYPTDDPYNDNVNVQGFKGEGTLRIKNCIWGIRYIRDWANGNSANSASHWVEVRALDMDGVNRVAGKTATSNNPSGMTNPTYLTNGNTASTDYVNITAGPVGGVYVQLDMGAVYDLQAIEVMMYYSDNRYYKDIKTQVSTDGVTWRTIWDNKKNAGNFNEVGRWHHRSAFINGYIHSNSCDRVELNNLYIDARSTDDYPVQAFNTGYMYCYRTIAFASAATLYCYYAYSSYMRLAQTESNGGTSACIISAYGSSVDLWDGNFGGDNPYGVYAYGSSVIAGEMTAPLGSTGVSKTAYGGDVRVSLTGSRGFYTKYKPASDTTTPIDPTPAPAQPKTKTWTSTDSESWRPNFGGSWYGGRDVLQGEWSGYGLYRGYWFFGDTVRAAVAGKSISKIRVYLSRSSSGGNSGAVTLYIRAHTYSTRPSSSAQPDYYSSAYGSSGFSQGQSKWVTLPSSMHAYFASNSCRGIMIYTSSTANSGYARMSGTAKIEITYT